MGRWEAAWGVKGANGSGVSHSSERLEIRDGGGGEGRKKLPDARSARVSAPALKARTLGGRGERGLPKPSL